MLGRAGGRVLISARISSLAAPGTPPVRAAPRSAPLLRATPAPRAALFATTAAAAAASSTLPQLPRHLRWPDAARPIEYASTLPAGWYTSRAAAAAERGAAFGASWQLVGHVGQCARPGEYFTGALAPWRYVVARGEDGVLRAFHNVSRGLVCLCICGVCCFEVTK